MATRTDLDRCAEILTDKVVVGSENGKSFGVLNPDCRVVRKIVIDGCVFGPNDGKKCDLVFELDEEGSPQAFYVELKGTDLNRAYKQLAKTLDNLVNIHVAFDRKCYIAGLWSPRFSPLQQRLRKRMQANYGIPLIVNLTPICVDRKGNVKQCP